jgi:negative regulator of sigma E activity
VAENQLAEDEPITFGRFAKPSYPKKAEVQSANQEAESEDSNAQPANEAVAPQLAQEPGEPAVASEVEENNRNQSSTDTRHGNPKLQQRQVSKTIQHGDEM